MIVDEPRVILFTPADVLRRLTAMGVLANVVTVWSYVRSRLETELPDRAAGAGPAELPVEEETLAVWLDDFADAADVQRNRLSRHLNPDRG